MTLAFPVAPADAGSEAPAMLRQHGRRLADTINNVMRGKLNAVGEITLAASSVTTVMTDSRLDSQSVVVLVPLTNNARSIQQSTGHYITARKGGSCTINHASNAATDLTYAFIILG